MLKHIEARKIVNHNNVGAKIHVRTNRECALHNYSDRWRLRSRLPVH